MKNLIQLNEDSRSQLIQRSKKGDAYKDQSKGKNRYERRLRSRISHSVSTYNSIDMNKLFKENILGVNVVVNGETNDYLVRMSFAGFLDYLHNQLKMNNDQLNTRVVTRALVSAFNSDQVYIHCSCLHPDTKIKLLDGTSPTVAELLERYESGEKLYTYSVDDKGDFKPGEIEKVWITGETSEFIKVTLDNGQEIITTPEHLYMLRDGSYRAAMNLEVGQLLSNKLIIKNIERIQLEDAVPIYDIKVKDFQNFLVDAGVILHNCPDWKYTMAFWATKNDINSVENEQKSNGKWIRNPADTKGAGCKHSLLVLSNNSWLQKVSSVIINYVKYMEKHNQKLYADIIYPAIYQQPYSDDVQLDIFDDTELASDETTIDTANKYARTKTQFKPGNQSGVQFSSPDKQISIDDVEDEETS